MLVFVPTFVEYIADSEEVWVYNGIEKLLQDKY